MQDPQEPDGKVLEDAGSSGASILGNQPPSTHVGDLSEGYVGEWNAGFAEATVSAP